MDNELEALKRAIAEAGGQSALAKLIEANTGKHCKQQNVWAWLHEAKRAPSGYALAISKVTKVKASELRPDLYPADEQAA